MQFSNKEYMDKGSDSKCYLLPNGQVLKEFNTPKDIKEIERYKYIKNYENENFIFPKEFICDSKKFYGYIMDKAPGKKLDDVFSKSNLIDLSTHSYKLEKNIDFLSKANITMYDFHGSNVLYDSKKYTVIDMDDYGIYKKDGVLEKNRHLHRVLIGNLFLENIIRNKYTLSVLNKIDKYKNMNILPSEMIVDIKMDLDYEFKENITTLDDLKKLK